MGIQISLSGVYAAAVTPLNPDLSPDLDGLADLLTFLARRGCHGVLIMGTTGEGPSFSINERIQIYQAAAEVVSGLTDFRLLAGTGTPSLEDSIYLTHTAFDLGYDGVVVLPPYYYKKASDDGLYDWFTKIIESSVPSDGALLGYHIPRVAGVGFSLELLTRIREAYPNQFLGIKDSSSDPSWAHSLWERFGTDLVVLNGDDRLFSLALQSGAAGCITAMANVVSPFHRLVWDAYQTGKLDEVTQGKLSQARAVLDRYTPMPPVVKILLSRLHSFPLWKVKPPLVDCDTAQIEIILSDFLAALELS
jgi:4-hydroxy-tetrahydrodipicolinate synthase